jgi:ElaB/YqjD/DUF883 family membrane-anchored ribosome-binding protein
VRSFLKDEIRRDEQRLTDISEYVQSSAAHFGKDIYIKMRRRTEGVLDRKELAHKECHRA